MIVIYIGYMSTKLVIEKKRKERKLHRGNRHKMFKLIYYSYMVTKMCQFLTEVCRNGKGMGTKHLQMFLKLRWLCSSLNIAISYINNTLRR